MGRCDAIPDIRTIDPPSRIFGTPYFRHKYRSPKTNVHRRPHRGHIRAEQFWGACDTAGVAENVVDVREFREYTTNRLFIWCIDGESARPASKLRKRAVKPLAITARNSDLGSSGYGGFGRSESDSGAASRDYDRLAIEWHRATPFGLKESWRIVTSPVLR
jgi:hypothetical protein